MKRDDLRAFLAEKPYDAMVLTSEISRRYATGFHSTAGAVYLSAKQAVFFTDFRYAEAARAAISDFEVREIKAGQSYSSLINGLIEEDGAKKIALEDKTLTYAEFMSWSTALHATAVRLEDGVESLRMMKEDSEVEKIVAAQRIAEQALEEVLNDIRIGVTEKEIAARLTYLMLHYGAENMSFDPIVVSGANSSKPHGVPTEKTIEAPTASPRGNSPLPAGSIVTAEPGIYLPGRFGVRIEDMLYVIEDGCIDLTDAPKSLLIL